jgi:hypothetical protein
VRLHFIFAATRNDQVSTFKDANGIIGPDGKTIPVKSGVQGVSDTSRATVIFDSGRFNFRPSSSDRLLRITFLPSYRQVSHFLKFPSK